MTELNRLNLTTFRKEQIEELLVALLEILPLVSQTLSNKIISGTFTGNLTGDVVGDVTGDLTGDASGLLKLPVQSYVADGAADETKGVHLLDGTGATVALTFTAPKPGEIHAFYCVDSTSAVTVSLGAGTFDGTNGTGTFTVGDFLIVLGITSTRFLVVVNSGVILSL